MLKIRRSHDRLIFNMGIPIPGKNGLYIETGPRCCFNGTVMLSIYWSPDLCSIYGSIICASHIAQVISELLQLEMDCTWNHRLGTHNVSHDNWPYLCHQELISLCIQEWYQTMANSAHHNACSSHYVSQTCTAEWKFHFIWIGPSEAGHLKWWCTIRNKITFTENLCTYQLVMMYN